MASGEPGTISSGLLRDIKQHSAEGWRRLVAIYGPLIYGWCRRAQLQPADAHDVSQEVLTSVAASIWQFQRRDSRSTFRGWLQQITRRKIIDFWRLQSHRPTAAGGSTARARIELIAEPDESEPSDIDWNLDEPNAQAAAVRRALALIRSEFSEATWAAFHQVCVEDRTPAEVAAALGITRNAVYLAKSRVLRRLRQELGELDEG